MKISIVTAAYNAQDTIKDAFDSVLSQTYGSIGHIEHIIVDGGSKDSTVEIIKEYAAKYHLNPSDNADQGSAAGFELKWISELDQGIYDALNKGIAMACGDIVGILHTDDLFHDENTLADIAAVFEKTSCDGLYADMLYVDRYDLRDVKRAWIAGKGNPYFGWCPPHQTVYLKKEIYTALGTYRSDFTNVSDYDYMIRIFIKNKHLRIEYLNKVTVIMRLGGLSTRGLKSHIHAFHEIQQSLKDQRIKFPTLVNGLRLLRKARQIRS